MKAFVIMAPYRAYVKDVENPHIQPNEVLIKVKACGICATDRHIYEGKFPARYPINYYSITLQSMAITH